LLYDKVRVAYLTAKENPKYYKDMWIDVIEQLQQNWNSPQPIGNLLRGKLSESLLFSDEAKDPEGSKAKRIYENLSDNKII
jgi:hypothetical protein